MTVKMIVIMIVRRKVCQNDCNDPLCSWESIVNLESYGIPGILWDPKNGMGSQGYYEIRGNPMVLKDYYGIPGLL